MATIILSILIFGYAGYVIVSKVRSKGSCDDDSCGCDCAAKPKKSSR